LLRQAAFSVYAVRRVGCCMPILAVLCQRLNRYYAYLANEVFLAWN
jgi:uncharacterized membrane protein